MIEIKETPEQRHEAALADFRHHLKEIRKQGRKLITSAEEAIRYVEPLLDATPEPDGQSEAELLASAKAIEGFSWRRLDDDLTNESHRIRDAIKYLLGALDEAQLCLAYLERGDFSDTDD